MTMKIYAKSNKTSKICTNPTSVESRTQHGRICSCTFLLVFVLFGFVILYTSNLIMYEFVKSSDYKKIVTALKKELLHDGRGGSAMLKKYIKFHFFNLTNPDEVAVGAKPRLQELGPYFYVERHFKMIGYTSDAMIKYRRNIYATFQPEVSVGSEDDLISLLDFGFIGICKTVWDSYGNISMISGVDQLLKSKGKKLLHTATVKDWIYTISSVQSYLNLSFPETEATKGGISTRVEDYKIGFNHDDNADTWLVLTNGENLGRVQEFNQKTKLDTWDTTALNEIRGTDGTIYPPLMNKASPLDLFLPEFCRSFKLKLMEYATMDDSIEFSFDPTTWTQTNSGDNSTLYGVVPLDKCFGGIPMFLSAPHFKDAHPDFAKGVQGLSPNNKYTDYNTSFYFEKNHPNRFKGRKLKLQLNVKLQQFPTSKTFSKVSNIMVPLLWTEEVEEVEYGDFGDFGRYSFSYIISITIFMTLYYAVGACFFAETVVKNGKYLGKIEHI